MQRCDFMYDRASKPKKNKKIKILEDVMAVYEKMAICDLRGITAEGARQIERIEKVALLILPTDADAETNAAIEAIPKIQIAQPLRLSADAQICTTNGLKIVTEADFGSKVHLVNGVAVIKSVPKGGTADFHVNGLVIIKEDQKKNMPGVNFSSVNGIVEYADFDDIKTITDELTMDAETIRWIKPKTAIVIAGELTFAANVTPEMLDEKGIVIVCAGEICCSKELEPYLKATVKGPAEIEVNE